MQMGWLPGLQLAELPGEEWAYLFLHHPGQEGASLVGGGSVLEPGTSLLPLEEGCFFAI